MIILKAFVIFLHPESPAAVYKNPCRLGMNILTRFLNFYLSLVDLVWSQHRVECEICGGASRKFGYGAAISIDWFPRNEVCLKCGAKKRTRTIITLLVHHVNLTSGKFIVVDVGASGSTTRYFERYPNIQYLTIDKFKHADVNSDITDIALPSNSVDVVICSHVLEHVEDYRGGIAELFRILKPGYHGIIAVPQTVGLKTSRRTMLKTFHGYGHIWEFGDDFSDKLADMGFEVSTVYQESTEDAYAKHNSEPFHIVLKPGA